MHPNRRDPVEDLRPVAARELELAQHRTAASPGTEPLSYDVYRFGEELRIDFDVPGVDPDAIDISLQQSTLNVSIRRELPADEHVEVIEHGRRHGTFRRTLLLPDHWDVDALTAVLENGVLRVSTPWRHVAARSVEVKVTGEPPRMAFGEPIGVGSAA